MVNLRKVLAELKRKREVLDQAIQGVEILIKGARTEGPSFGQPKSRSVPKSKAKRVPRVKKMHFPAGLHIMRFLSDGKEKTGQELLELFKSVASGMSHKNLTRTVYGTLNAYLRSGKIVRHGDRYGIGELTAPALTALA